MERGEPVDSATYCRIMFDGKTSAELPEHEEWIHGHAIPLLKSRYGIETSIVQGPKTYVDCFYTVVHKRTKNYGKIWGWPFFNAAWCNSDLKMRPIQKWKETVGEHTQIVGIAADEPKRIGRATVAGKVLPLVEQGVTELEAFDVCRKADLLSPAYNGGRCRLGCWFCHNQRVGELRRLRRERPALWNKLIALDEDSPTKFKPDKTLVSFEKRFAREDAQTSLFDLDYLKQTSGEN